MPYNPQRVSIRPSDSNSNISSDTSHRKRLSQQSQTQQAHQALNQSIAPSTLDASTYHDDDTSAGSALSDSSDLDLDVLSQIDR